MRGAKSQDRFSRFREDYHMTQLRQRKCTIGQHASYLVSLLAITFSGCGSLPPDEPLCVEITMTRGYCVKTMSGDTFTVDDMNLLKEKTLVGHAPDHDSNAREHVGEV